MMQSLPIREGTAVHGRSLTFPYGERIGDLYEKEIISHFIRISHVSAVTGRNTPVPDYAGLCRNMP
jgi:hypothetical protein